MAYFGYNTCIGCMREWSKEDKREGHEWWPLRSQQGQRWLCHTCVKRAWRKAEPAANIGSCPEQVKDALQTQEFQTYLRYILEKHFADWATEQMELDEEDDEEL